MLFGRRIREGSLLWWTMAAGMIVGVVGIVEVLRLMMAAFIIAFG